MLGFNWHGTALPFTSPLVFCWDVIANPLMWPTLIVKGSIAINHML